MRKNYLRKKISQLFTGEKEIALKANIPSLDELSSKFQHIDELGLYLHIPFCEQICPYCP